MTIMDSPVVTLSRSPSSSSFAPGRRPHPNLQHLSLAPLTPKYPIEPADYSPYFDPDTSELHTSTSLSHISALPSPGGILTNSPARSRANSKTRLKKKTRSHVSISLPDQPPTDTGTSTPSGALTSQGFGHSTLRPTNSHTKTSSLSRSHLGESGWLVQTGLSLTASSRENKGQSWLAQRDSSTSLSSLHTAQEEQPPRSGHTTPFGSHPTSRAGSRANSRTRRSRKDLTMTMTSTTTPNTSSHLHLSKIITAEDTEEVEYIQPDWTDKETQAEIAAQVAADMSDELDDDPYGMLNFEDQIDVEFDTEDEEEVRKQLRSNKGWFDGVVDVFLRLEEQEDEYPDESELESDLEKGTVGISVDGAGSGGTRGAIASRERDELLEEDDVEAPPEQPQGVWADIKWFGRVIARTVRT